MVGAPSPLEFIQSTFESVPALRNHSQRKLLELISIYLAKMALHHPDLYSKSASQIAASSIFVANKIFEQMIMIKATDAGLQKEQVSHLEVNFLIDLLSRDSFVSPSRQIYQFSSPGKLSPPKVDSKRVSELIDNSKRLLSLAQNFESEMPGLKHLQSLYMPKIEEMVAEVNLQ